MPLTAGPVAELLADHHLAVLEDTRPHLELYRTSMEERGLAASTIDRRLSTDCGFCRFAHTDGRIVVCADVLVRISAQNR